MNPEALPIPTILFGKSDTFSRALPHQLIEQHANATPDKVAVRYELDTLTYRELNNHANELAKILISLGLRCGSRCGVSIKPCLDIAVAVLAIHKIGATYLPLDPESPDHRLSFILGDAKPDLIIVQSITKTQCLENFSTLNIDDQVFSDAPEFDTNLDVSPDDQDIANIFYTSGTTGHPKGVLASYRNYRNYVNVAVDRFSMNHSTTMPIVAKFTFSISLFELMTPLAAGGAVVIVARDTVLSPPDLLQVFKQCTMIHIGPSLWLRLTQAIEDGVVHKAQFGHLQHVSSGGDMVPPELLVKLTEFFVNAEVYVVYGCSEVSCMGTSFLVDRKEPVRKTFVGIPFANTNVAIVEYEGNKLASPGDKGEICFSGNGVVTGYIGKSEDFKKKQIEIEGKMYYRTGDVGRINRLGQVEMLGREDFQIKVNGIRIELAEIDYHLRKAPGVTQGITMNWQSDDGDNRIYAYITDPLSADQIRLVRDYLQNNLLEQMLPKNFIYIQSLPLNPNLKVDRKALPKPNGDNIIRESVFGIAKSKTEKSLLSIWQSILGSTEIGIDDDFFYSGGSSLNGVDLMQSIEKNMGVTLSLNALMANRTIRTLSEIIDNRSENAILSIQIRKTDDPACIFFIHDGNGDVIPYSSLSRQLNSSHSIYGITPRSRGNCSMYDVSFEELVATYVAEIKRVSSSGPYILGGLCIGGYIAYCVASELQAQGNEVQSVILFDSHNIDANPISNYESNIRSSRLRQAFDEVKMNSFTFNMGVKLIKTLASKVYNYLRYELYRRAFYVYRKVQFSLLKLARRFPLLTQYNLPYPSVDTVLRLAESAYRKRDKFNGNIILFLAGKKLSTLDYLDIDDTPYRELFEGDDLGWGSNHSDELTIYPIEAGHSTILTPPYSSEIAQHLAKHLL